MEDYNDVLRAFSFFITGSPDKKCAPLTEDAMKRFFACSVKQKILPMTVQALFESGVFQPTDRLGTFTLNSVRSQIAAAALKTHEFYSLYEEFLNAGAMPLCVKGVVLGELYPRPEMRLSGDEDLLVTEKDFGICRTVLLSHGYQADGDGFSFETGFVKGNSRIELHKALFSPDSPFTASFNELLGDLFQKTETLHTEEITVHTVAKDKHLLFVILHAFKHFYHAGVGIRQICDISLLAQSFDPDWKAVVSACRSVHADGFLMAALHIAEDWFGFDPASLRAATDLYDKCPGHAAMLDDIMSGAVYGADTRERLHAGAITANKTAGTGQKKSLFSSVFPTMKTMKKKYTYLEKYPFLLPAAWISRAAGYLKSGSDTSEVLSIGQKRLDLLKLYGVIDK